MLLASDLVSTLLSPSIPVSLWGGSLPWTVIVSTTPFPISAFFGGGHPPEDSSAALAPNGGDGDLRRGHSPVRHAAVLRPRSLWNISGGRRFSDQSG